MFIKLRTDKGDLRDGAPFFSQNQLGSVPKVSLRSLRSALRSAWYEWGKKSFTSSNKKALLLKQGFFASAKPRDYGRGGKASLTAAATAATAGGTAAGGAAGGAGGVAGRAARAAAIAAATAGGTVTPAGGAGGVTA